MKIRCAKKPEFLSAQVTNMKNIIAIVALLLVSNAHAATLFYVPFKTETLAAVTPQSIVCESARVWSFSKDDVLNDFLITGHDFGSVDTRKIRLRLETKDKAIVVDSQGRGSDGERSFQFDTNAIEKYLTAESMSSQKNAKKSCDEKPRHSRRSS